MSGRRWSRARYPYPRPNTAFMGIRGVLGVDVDLVEAPVQLFVELSSALAVAPRPWLSLGGTLGARYSFGSMPPPH